VVAYSRQDRAAWLDGHVAAFTTWGGAPAAIWYGNLSPLGRLVGGRFDACEDGTFARYPTPTSDREEA
jgi:transposase